MFLEVRNRASLVLPTDYIYIPTCALLYKEDHLKEKQKKAQEKPRSWVEEAPWTLPSLRTHLACLPLCSLRGGPPGVWAVE